MHLSIQLYSQPRAHFATVASVLQDNFIMLTVGEEIDEGARPEWATTICGSHCGTRLAA